MKSRTLVDVTTISLLVVLAIPVRLASQGQNQQPGHYTVADIGTLGGTFGEANAVNNKGWVVGDATLPGDIARHAFLWRKGVTKDLGTLGGPNSIALYPLNERGDITGFSDSSTPDPLSEDFCGFGTNLTCLPFLWQHGVMTPLPTLGGNNGQALEVNNRGQVVGVAENTTPDLTCVDTAQVVQFKPVIWQKGEIIHELPTFPGDPDGFALGGLVFKRSNVKAFVDLILAARQAAGDLPLHVLGVAGPNYVPLLVFLGVDTFDSSSSVICGGYRHYFAPDRGSVEFSSFEGLSYLPCVCPVCSVRTASEVHAKRDLVSMHNLWHLASELRRLRWEIATGDVPSYLESRFSRNPLLKRAFLYARQKMRGL